MQLDVLKKGDKVSLKSVIYVIYDKHDTDTHFFIYKEGLSSDSRFIANLSEEGWSHAPATATNVVTKSESNFDKMLEERQEKQGDKQLDKQAHLGLDKALEQINTKKKSALDTYRESKMQKDSVPVDTPAIRTGADMGTQYTQLLTTYTKHISILLDMVKEEGELLKELAKHVTPNGKETTT